MYIPFSYVIWSRMYVVISNSYIISHIYTCSYGSGSNYLNIIGDLINFPKVHSNIIQWRGLQSYHSPSSGRGGGLIFSFVYQLSCLLHGCPFFCSFYHAGAMRCWPIGARPLLLFGSLEVDCDIIRVQQMRIFHIPRLPIRFKARNATLSHHSHIFGLLLLWFCSRVQRRSPSSLNTTTRGQSTEGSGNCSYLLWWNQTSEIE